MSRRPEPAVYVAVDTGVGMCFVGNWKRYTGPAIIVPASHHNVVTDYRVSDSSDDEQITHRFGMHAKL